MYAVVRSGGRQYRASVGDTVLVERLGAPVGQQLEMDQVLLIADGEQVTQEKGPKIRVFKYRPKQRYRRRAGHRQWYTRLRVDQIVV